MSSIKEYGYVKIQIYRDNKGRHVCRRNAKQVCPYLGVGNYGTVDYCMLGTPGKLEYWDDDPYTYIKPSCGIAKLQI